MSRKEITSHDALKGLLKDTEKSYLLLWKRGSGQSECAFSALSSASAKHPGRLSSGKLLFFPAGRSGLPDQVVVGLDQVKVKQ